jgi:hypothetical protein
MKGTACRTPSVAKDAKSFVAAARADEPETLGAFRYGSAPVVAKDAKSFVAVA